MDYKKLFHRKSLLGLLILCSSQLFTNAKLMADVPILPMPKHVTELVMELPDKFYDNIEFYHSGGSEKLTASLENDIISLLSDNGTGSIRVHCNLLDRKSQRMPYRQGLERYFKQLGQEGYILVRTGDSAEITALDEKGVFYGLQSLKQLLRTGYPNDVTVVDWPDFAERIFFDDISRGPLPNVVQIKKEIEQLAELKYNAMNFYIEHVVQVSEYPDFAPVNGKLTMAQVREICEHAAKYNMEVIGGFQSFGHFEHILKLPQYAHMGETSSLISPVDDDAREFLRSVIGELCDNFSSKYFNINCDETWDLDKGRSRDYVAKIGADKFYADHIRFLNDIVTSKGKTTMVWGDIIMKYPHLIKQLPKGIIYLPWNYSNLDDFSAWIDPFSKGKVPFMVCPGVVSSNRMTPEMHVVWGNMEFIRQGYKAGANGVMLTSWDDTALHNFSSLMYGIALGAETMWNVNANVSKEEFDNRFELTRFGVRDAGFVETLDKLLELAGIGVTYQMIDKVFYDRFVPMAGESISINETQWKKVLEVVEQTEKLFDKIKRKFNDGDIETLEYTIRQYRFLADSRLAVVQAADIYEKAMELYDSDITACRNKMIEGLNAVVPLSVQVMELENTFSQLWLNENMSYYQDYGQDRYREKLEQAQQLKQSFINAVNAIDSDLKPVTASEAGLSVRTVNSDYFGAWLFTGFFPNGDLDVDYLESRGGERNENPIPGERYSIDGNDYIWTRVLSPNGFVMDFNAKYDSDNNALAYATAVIISGSEREVTALFGCSGQAEIICNGEVVMRTGTEQDFTADKYKMTLKLHEGNNRIIVKSRQLVKDWRFSFRIDGEEVQANKQRYRIN